ncbi:hypothetical protein CP8484711_0792A, partial [Chlamydia psittaci 84-8471/1]
MTFRNYSTLKTHE